MARQYPALLRKKEHDRFRSREHTARARCFYKLDIKANFSNAVANGTFSAAGGSGNDIVALIGDEQNVINWKNNHKAQVLWQTDGEQTVGSFNVPLKSGTAYYLVLSNTSSESAKQVTINATLTFKESDAKATDP